MNEATTIAVRRSITVDAPQARAFDIFRDMTAWWPLATHTIGAAPARASIVEPRVGGRWYGIDNNGDEHGIGRVLAYEPPERIVLTWEIAHDWRYDPSLRTEIEVRFIAESAARTRVELEHRGLEAYGQRAEEQRAVYEADDAWTYVVRCFADAVAPRAAFTAIALHAYVPEYVDAFRSFCERVIANTEGADGLIGFEVLHDAAGGRLVGLSRWASRAAFDAALPRIMALSPERKPEWSVRPDEVLFLDACTPSS